MIGVLFFMYKCRAPALVPHGSYATIRFGAFSKLGLQVDVGEAVVGSSGCLSPFYLHS